MKRSIFFVVLFIIVLFAIFVFLMPRGGGEEPISAESKTTTQKSFSFIWSIGPDVEADLAKNSLNVTARGTANMEEMANAVQAESVALKTARHLAYEKLAETLGGVRVVGQVTYRDLDPTGDTLTMEVNTLVKGARIADEKVTKDPEGSPVAEVTLTMPLYEKEKGFFSRMGDFIRSGKVGFSVEGLPSPGKKSEPDVVPVDKIARAQEPATGTVPKKAAEKGRTAEKTRRAGSVKKTSRVTGVIFQMASHQENMAALPRVLEKSGRILVNLATDMPYELLVEGPVIVADSSSRKVRKTVGKKPLTLQLTSSQDYPGDLIASVDLDETDRDLVYTYVSQGRFLFLVEGDES